MSTDSSQIALGKALCRNLGEEALQLDRAWPDRVKAM